MYFVWLLPGCCLAGQRLPSHPHLTRASLRLRWHYRTFWKVSSCLPSLVGGACPSQSPLAGNPAGLAGAALERGHQRGDEGGHVWSCQAEVRAGPGCAQGQGRSPAVSRGLPLSPQPCGKHLLFPGQHQPGQSPGEELLGAATDPEERNGERGVTSQRTVQPASNKPQTHTSQGRT